MPVHDWTRVKAGIFHHFHHRWIAAISDSLNSGLLPRDFYALAEQLAGRMGPDVLTLQSRNPPESDAESSGALSLATAPPQVSHVSQADEVEWYAAKRNAVVIRHSTDDEVIALLEIISPGNRQTQKQLDRFVDKALDALFNGIHLTIVDVLPPGRRDSDGIHGAIWAELQSEPYRAPPEKPFTIVSYCAAVPPRAYVEPIAPRSVLPEMPLFIEEETYVNVPLERTYMESYATVPERWRRVIEGRDV